MPIRPSAALRHFVAITALAAAPLALAEAPLGQPAALLAPSYFITPYAQIDDLVQNGFMQNGATQGSVAIDTRVSAFVDLATGTTKNYLVVTGPGQFGQSAGVMGDQLMLTGTPGLVNFSFAFDGSVASNVGKLGSGNLQIGITANLRVFDASAGATSANFAGLPGALVSDTRMINFDNPGNALSEPVSQILAGALSFAGGSQAVDIFASLSIFTSTNDNPIVVTMDFKNTGTFGAQAGAGILFSSASGVFPGSVSPIPEPQSWAMMLVGLMGLAWVGRHRA